MEEILEAGKIKVRLQALEIVTESVATLTL